LISFFLFFSSLLGFLLDFFFSFSFFFLSKMSSQSGIRHATGLSLLLLLLLVTVLVSAQSKCSKKDFNLNREKRKKI